jgi:protocatechuate 3,4-dioxygenase beta subunit
MPDSISSVVRIAPENEPGEPMVISGTVFDRTGAPAPGVIVYAYHTDAAGIYPKRERLRGTEAYAHGRLRAWARSDEMGRYQFHTIRPGAYPSGSNPQHVHMHVLEVGCCTYYLSSIKFTDDPLLSEAEREQALEGRGGNALVTPRRNEAGVWIVNRDIYLGRGIPGYPVGSRPTL